MLDSMANIEEILDNNQDEAASNCNQSPEIKTSSLRPSLVWISVCIVTVRVIVMILYYLSLQLEY